MKKIVLMMAGALCLGAAAYAQEPAQQQAKDSTSFRPSQPAEQTQQPQTDPSQTPTDPSQTPQTPQPQAQQQPTEPAQQPSQSATVPAYRKDMTQIQPGDVPTGLRSTLDRPQFKGWENGAVYSNTDKSVFIVEIKDEVEGRLKAYRFDANGKPITDN
ncbi:hypothetical protein WBG78_21840 [Chryseolinea sp. T2]|uniref:hypothetical protein n=1 Tax=Chryseolinea sp. T2 TaxID=3129255 RepID=UPI003078999E